MILNYYSNIISINKQPRMSFSHHFNIKTSSWPKAVLIDLELDQLDPALDCPKPGSKIPKLDPIS